MVELKYVQKRKRKKIVAIVSAAAAMGIVVLGLTSFLGRFVGQFTVSLDRGNLELTMSEDEAFSKRTSYLRISNMPPFGQTNYDGIRADAGFVKRPSDMEVSDDETLDDVADRVLDTQDTKYTLGGEPTQNDPDSLNYLKYTFFLRNEGDEVANYDFKVNVLNSTSSDNDRDRYLLDSLRVRVFQNYVVKDGTEAPEEHQSYLYGRQADVYAANPINGIESIEKTTQGTIEEGDTYTITYTEGGTDQFKVSYDKSGMQPTGIKNEETGKTPRVYIGDNGHWIVNNKDSGIASAGIREESFEKDNRICTITTKDFKKQDVMRYTLVIWLDGDDPDSVSEPPEGSTLQLGVTISAYGNQ